MSNFIINNVNLRMKKTYSTYLETTLGKLSSSTYNIKCNFNFKELSGCVLPEGRKRIQRIIQIDPNICTTPAAIIDFAAHCDNDNKIPRIV